jgi:hypothetical protein
MSLRSNATPSGNAQRINDTAGMGLHMCLCSSWRSYATRGMTDTGSQRCEANELANPNITHALRKARVDAQAPLRSCSATEWHYQRVFAIFPTKAALPQLAQPEDINLPLANWPGPVPEVTVPPARVAALCFGPVSH